MCVSAYFCPWLNLDLQGQLPTPIWFGNLLMRYRNDVIFGLTKTGFGVDNHEGTQITLEEIATGLGKVKVTLRSKSVWETNIHST